ncbi:MAG: TIGR02221 family CRISPR-associated protein, partial [Elioraea sp.]|nr:TIGR02221 family CRISPR-associated protein [Elioraea sp.]
MHTLVTFLGSARLDPKTGYRTARYRFENGAEEETPFFGLALARQIRPDRVLVLGTSGSSWPALVEHAVHEGAEEARLALIEASERGKVTQALLDSVQPIASSALALELRLRVVPYAVDEREQREILAIVGTEIRSGEASFDVTHGLRHLALL